MLEADYILVHTLLGTGDQAGCIARSRRSCAISNADGGWNTYPGGPSNISASVKAYFALKLMGWSADDPRTGESREWILANGGATECNTFTKMYLCFFGQYDYDAVPAIPPEIVLFPKWFYFNIYEISSWSRAMLVPLSIAYAKKPFKKIPPEQGIDELFVGGRAQANLRLHWDKKIFSWRNFFLVLDRSRIGLSRSHAPAARDCAEERRRSGSWNALEMSDGLGAIYPGHAQRHYRAALPGIFRGRSPGHSRTGTNLKSSALKQAATAEKPEPTFRMQPCGSPVWDTAQVVYALGEAGVSQQRSAHVQGRRLDVVQRSSPQGRLGRQSAPRRAGRLVFRVQQRVLPRHRRFCAGAAGAQ